MVDSIGRITTRGKVAVYEHPRIDFAKGITVGPDGALWFTNSDSIGRITNKGKFTFYADPSISIAWGITVGSDHALWFTNQFGDSICRLRILKPR